MSAILSVSSVDNPFLSLFVHCHLHSGFLAAVGAAASAGIA